MWEHRYVYIRNNQGTSCILFDTLMIVFLYVDIFAGEKEKVIVLF